ncbi:unnamed protein product [Ilex paraguariensis]|uniref:Phytocyanin domain-containing protein n=1 Tax=Ilex paraguariensis TaxID=185542 RepID=A0ABC8RZ94_9AQUA
MANTSFRSNHHDKPFCVLLLLGLLLLIQKGGAYEFKVGGSQGWTVPADANANSYNQWAESNRFQIGDSLLFVYPADKDSVVRVTKEDYTNCNSATPLDKFTDGHSVFKFDQSGPYYFISGVKENCLKNEKLVVVVMADRNNRSSTEVPPSTAPAGEEAPSPPSGSVEINPSPSPFGETPPPPPPPPSGATSIYMGVIGCVGTFISSLALVL